MNWNGALVLVTGMTGSFGKAFARLILREPIAKLICYSRDEAKQEDLARRMDDPRVRFILGDVRDRDALMLAFDGIDIVVHAAALKRVPAGEYSPEEFIKTNVDGTRNVVHAARERNVERVMLLSSDKAVAAVNVYGKTKSLAESYIVAANSYTPHKRTRYAATRYGNVIGSRGSVIPKWMQQRDSGQPLSITDYRMTRFFISLGYAASFVKARIEDMRGGEVFVPLLPSARMVDVAAAIAPDVETIEVGIRPGEKLGELLILEEESPRATRLQREVGLYVVASTGEGQTFTYSSQANPWFLSVEDLRREIPKALAEAGEN